MRTGPAHPSEAGNQVLQDYHGINKDSQGIIAPADHQHYQKRVGEFVGGAGIVGGRRVTTDLVQAYQANASHCRSFDNALQLGAGMSCKDFQIERPPAPLKLGEKRFWIAVKDCPADVRDVSSERKLRSCIRDDAGRTRLEVCWGGARRVLQSHCDAGSDNFVNKLWLFSAQRLRGNVWIDTTHRRHNNFKDACNKAGVDWALEDMVLICSIGSAPWGKCGHYGKYSEALQEYVDNNDHTDELWNLMLPYITFISSRGRPSQDWNAEENSVRFFASLSSCGLLFKKSGTAKQGRWFQPTCRFRDFTESVPFLALGLLYVAVTFKWYPDLDSSPLRLGAASAMAAEDGDGDEPLAAGANALLPRGVGISNANIDKKSSIKSSLHLVLQAITDNRKLALYMALTKLAEPIEEEHGRTLVAHKASWTCLEWCQEMACSRRLAYFDALWGLLGSPSMLRQCGLICNDNVLFPIAEPARQEIADCLFQFVVSFVGSDILYLETWRTCPAGRFAALTSVRAAERTDALQYLKTLFAALMDRSVRFLIRRQ